MMLFGAWTLVKTIGIFLLGRSIITPELIEVFESNGGMYEDKYYYIALLVAAAAVAIDQGFRVYVGMSAVSEGRGRHCTILYIVIACVFIWNSIWTIGGLCVEFGNGFIALVNGKTVELHHKIIGQDVSLSSIVIELTSLIMLIELVYSSIRIRALTGRSRKHRKNGKHGK